MTRHFSIVDNTSILFGETTLQWSLDHELLSDIRYGRNLVKFNVVNVRILDLLFDYDLTEDEEDQIRDYLWSYFFLVSRSR
jgi:hypothetical protein